MERNFTCPLTLNTNEGLQPLIASSHVHGRGASAVSGTICTGPIAIEYGIKNSLTDIVRLRQIDFIQKCVHSKHMPHEFDSQYDPKAHEKAVYERWEQANIFQPNGGESFDANEKNPFVIMLPPPNITGSLHMGHALQDTIMDCLSRWHRMMGDPTLWLPGTDHAALPTNKIINDQLYEEGTSREEVGREEFNKRTEAWYEKTGAEILNQMRSLGCSCDWSRNRFTMDEKYVDAVNEAFIQYYEKGYIYRGARIVNWDPKTQTTVSDLEIDWKTEKAPFYTFKYGPFEISTARPETKFGDKYVVMHPDDARYEQYKHGDTFEAQWINGTVQATVIKDEAVDPEFGSGVMTITPWHDVTDFEIAQRHDLDMEQVIDYEGKLLPIAEEFTGQPIEDARPKIVEKLEAKGLLVSVDESYEHNIALNDRGKGVIEPQIMRQWFVDMSKLKEDTIKVAEDEIIQFVPPRWKEHFIEWMENVHDWNINRQIWLGHRLPVWWKKGAHGSDQEEGNFTVAIDPPAGGPEGEWEQDPDTLDTWFSSALWPFATLGWPEVTEDLQQFYPSSVIVTGRDILYLWVARMVFSGLELLQDDQFKMPKLEDRIPFQDVFIHPVVLAKDGQRMSKSLGTGIDPMGLIEEYGADATRFGLMHQMNYDMQHMKFDEDGIKAARNFTNKLWNIARFLTSMDEQDEPTIADQWIKQRVGEVTEEVSELLQSYKIGEAARLLQDFVRKDFADWYVEILKTRGSTVVAREVFLQTLQLLHPLMPFVTEVLFEKMGGEGLIAESAWPSRQGEKEVNHTEMQKLMDAIQTIRSVRSLLEIKPSVTVDIMLPWDHELSDVIEKLAFCRIVESEAQEMRQFPLPSGESIALGSSEITAESLQAAREKIETDIKKLQDILEMQQASLENMREKAPQDKVEEKEKNIETISTQLEQLQQSKTLLT